MIDPTHQRAQLLFQQGRYDMAGDALRGALAHSPNDPFAHGLLALCLLHQNKFDEATAEAQSAILHAPDMPFAHYALAATFQNRNRYPEAEAAIREALRLAPDNAEYWALLAQTFIARRLWPSALEAADQGLQFDPEHPLCVNLRAVALVNLGRKDEAAHSIAGLLQRNPHDANSHANQGWTLLHQNRPKEALEHFREALRLDPNHEWARQGMIAALKARHLLYRLMLRYYLWISRFSRKGQWGLVIGLWIGFEILSAIRRANPQLAPYVLPLLIAYVLFALGSWLADPIFNLTLLLNRFGRYLLSATQRIGALLVGFLLLTGLSLVALGFFADSGLALILGALELVLSLSVATTTRLRQPAHLRLMIAYTSLVALLGLVAIFAPLPADLALDLLLVSLWGGLLSSLASNLLGSLIIKR